MIAIVKTTLLFILFYSINGLCFDEIEIDKDVYVSPSGIYKGSLAIGIPFRDQKPEQFYFPNLKGSDLTSENKYSLSKEVDIDSNLFNYSYYFFSHELIGEVNLQKMKAVISRIESGWVYDEILCFTYSDTTTVAHGYLMFSKDKLSIELRNKLKCQYIENKSEDGKHHDKYTIDETKLSFTALWEPSDSGMASVFKASNNNLVLLNYSSEVCGNHQSLLSLNGNTLKLLSRIDKACDP